MNCSQCAQVLREGALFCDSCGLATTLAESVMSSPLSVEAGSEPDPWLGKIIGEKYQILTLLGRGGMGSVYRARRLHIGDEVAVKVLHRQYVNEEKTVERFRREARAAAMLRHPTVVAIHDFSEGQAHEPAFIVMELVEGTTLRKILENEGSLESARAVALVRDVCKGVGVAHRLNLVHRDIKPDNIMILPPDVDDARERVKVVDFGIAKLRDMAAAKALTQTGNVIGTVYYMSPEQCCAEHLDARSDVYSLGAVLYEMLAGAPPFTGDTATAIVAKHLSHPVPPLPAALGIAPELERVLARALAKEPAARPADASELRKELGAAVGALDAAGTAEELFKDTIGAAKQTHSSSTRGVVSQSVSDHGAAQVLGARTKSATGPASGSWVVVALVAFMLLVGGFIMLRKPWAPAPANLTARANVSLGNPESWRIAATLATDSKVYALAFSKDDQLLVTANSEGLSADREFVSEIKFWNAASGQLLRSVTEHSEGVLALAFSPNGKAIVSVTGSGSAASKIGKVKLWDAGTGTLRWAVNGHTDYATTVAFAPDGKTIASGSLDHSVKLWTAETGTLSRSLPQADSIWAIAFSPSGKILAIAGQRTLELWNTDTGELQQSLGPDAHPRAVAFSPDGQWLVSGDVNGTVSLWDAKTGALQKSLSEHTDVVDALAFSPDGKLLASGAYDKNVIVWEVQSGTKLRALADSDKVTAVAFSTNGRFASGGWARTVRVWGQ